MRSFDNTNDAWELIIAPHPDYKTRCHSTRQCLYFLTCQIKTRALNLITGPKGPGDVLPMRRRSSATPRQRYSPQPPFDFPKCPIKRRGSNRGLLTKLHLFPNYCTSGSNFRRNIDSLSFTVDIHDKPGLPQRLDSVLIARELSWFSNFGFRFSLPGCDPCPSISGSMPRSQNWYKTHPTTIFDLKISLSI